MAIIRLTTLTPLHIGSGDVLLNNAEFIYFGAPDNCVSIIDPLKILGLLGGGAVAIDRWTQLINAVPTNVKGSKRQYLKDDLLKRKQNLKPEDVEIRRIKAATMPTDNLRLFIADAADRRYIPGSALKGAIRTALFAKYVNKNLFDIKSIEKPKFADTELAKDIFGADPNHNLMRLIRVGDAYFDDDNTTCESLSVYYLNQETPPGISIPVECIPKDRVATFQLSNPTPLLGQKNRRLLELQLIKLQRFQQWDNITKLFKLINAHTLDLVTREIQRQSALIEYTNELKAIQNEIKNNLSDTSCILRMGFASGYRSMTGDWTEMLPKKDYEKIVAKARIKRRDKPEDTSLPFPKTRQLTQSQQPLGFVKLELVSDAVISKDRQRFTERVTITAKEKPVVITTIVPAESAQPTEILPTPFTGKLKQGAEIEAKCIESKGNDKIMELYIDAKLGGNQKVKLNYPSELSKDDIHIVEVTSIDNKGRIQNIRYKKKK
jgi:CRISPR type III-A-associated RAMP protein Csm5